MTPRRVLLRIKKLRRFLDERIADAVRERDGAHEPEARAEAAGRLAAYQEVRGEMVGERLDTDGIETGAEEDGGENAGAGSSDEADAERDEASEEASGEATAGR